MTFKRGIILYGPPAVGKDTVTRALTAIGGRYEHFRRLKIGAGRGLGYRITTQAALSALCERGDVLYANSRYGATYVIDRDELDNIAGRGHVPVLHLGQVGGITAVTTGYPLSWLVVALWCSREETEQRLVGRQDSRIAERLAAWDETLADFRSADLAIFALTLNTAAIEPGLAAKVIDSCCR